MAYDITIGELLVEFNQAERYINLSAVEVELPDAPAFGDPTDRMNQRWPSYGVWRPFLKEVGLLGLFYDTEGTDPNGGDVLGGHPGVVPLTQGWADKVHAARLHREATNGGKPAGFFAPDETSKHEFDVKDNGNDPHLARLIWLDFWCDWAMKNCKQPVIANR
jgi:hypothetical protein